MTNGSLENGRRGRGRPARVSVVLPVRNGLPYLADAVNSILTQTYADLELVVSNNHSTDGTGRLLESITDPRLQVVRPPRPLSLADSHRFAIEQAHGELLWIMAADDAAEPDKIAKQVAALDADPTLVLVGCWCTMIDRNGRTIGVIRPPSSPEAIQREIVRRNPFIAPALLLRRAAYDAVGGIHEELGPAFDYDRSLRMLRIGRGANLPEPLLQYRFHAGMHSLQNAQSLRRSAVRARWRALRQGRRPIADYRLLLRPAAAAMLPTQLLRVITVPYIRFFKGRDRLRAGVHHVRR